MALDLIEGYLEDIGDPRVRRIIERVLRLEEEHSSYKTPPLHDKVLAIVREEASKS